MYHYNNENSTIDKPNEIVLVCIFDARPQASISLSCKTIFD